MIQQRPSPVEQIPALEMFEVTDPVELEQARVRREHFDRNCAWYQAHVREVDIPERRGKYLCVAGEEAFFGDSVHEAIAQARAAHPDDPGWFTGYLPRQRVPRIYAN